ncbi:MULTISPECIES: UvrD-helicase domain-containing protein [unclassified Brevibacterium]|uniref:UvrD-helicase domain-containing protein n=1 Tax=unclassified Brevibacterium TaxID=2614124 RepID=UPI001E44C1B9|nr:MULTISPECIES: UvrD-helicase domain-containing protein [unclassified Brevibacterium]MCD1287792.1 exonuclease V subunit beta [Brevibacterium sp. CCUG 69071]MDK8435099.1 UvrD-helicase domain-containing protein [Brevibacterium sp. H-BE7]
MSVHVITASAGSGKTYRLTEVLSERLSQKDSAGVPLLRASEVIATTFTVRAAADLIEKTQKRLLDDGNITAAEEIGTALIGTINSMSGRLVSEYAIDAGYSPELRVLDENEQKIIFATAVDEVVANAEIEHRDLLVRTGHNGRPEDANPYGSGPVAWSDLVTDIAEAARSNHLGEAELRASARDSVELFLSALPSKQADNRQMWRDCLASDIDLLRESVHRFRDGEDLPDGVPKMTRTSADNVEGSIVTLDHFLRDLDTHAEDADPFARTPWSTWVRVAKASYSAAQSGKAPGVVPKTVLESSSASLVSDQLLSNSAFHTDIAVLTDLVIDTAIASLSAYEDHKNRLGVMDFVDQEVRALDLLRSSDRVRASVASRYRLLAVDEFQDSSPIQLAIFMELADLVDEVIWVGDRKQAIYGFRGADPELMNDVFAALISGSTDLGTATSENLGASWRSTEPPLELSNTLFSSVFSDQDENEVVLRIPPQREHLRNVGSRELWVPNTDKGKTQQANSRMAKAIAEGVVDLLGRSPQLPGGELTNSDIAILVPTNSQVDSVVASLKARGIRAIGSTTDLLATREGQFVASGLAAVVDRDDAVALTELVTLIPDHGSHHSWFEETARIHDKTARHQHYRTWWNDPTLASLAEAEVNAARFSAAELVLAVIDALDLPQRIKAWTHPETRLATLDALCQIAAEYEDSTQQTRSPITPAGLLHHLTEAAGSYEQTTAHDAVLVTTMHQSKGLQWPVVIVGVPVAKDFGHREITVEKAPVFDARQPLANRSLRYLPGVIKDYGPLKDRLAGLDSVRSAGTAEKRETERLLYVALTRAECHSIVAFGDPTGKNNVLSMSVDERLLEWDVPTLSDASSPAVEEAGVVRIADLRSSRGGGSPAQHELAMRISAFPIDGATVGAGESRVEPRSFLAQTDIPRRAPAAGVPILPARFTASSVPSEGIDADVSIIASLGDPLVAHGGQEWDRVGDAIHAYLGLPLAFLPAGAKQSAADRILARWDSTRILSTDLLIELGDRWCTWIEETFPGAEVVTESPIAWRNDEGQVMEGWIDARIVLPGGEHILVDHKSYPGTDSIGHVTNNYLGQLATYSHAIETAHGAAPTRVLIHLPLKSEVLEVRLRR